MMNAILLSNGFPIISIPAKRQEDFNQWMLDFYAMAEVTGMNTFLKFCLNEKVKPDQLNG